MYQRKKYKTLYPSNSKNLKNHTQETKKNPQKLYPRNSKHIQNHITKRNKQRKPHENYTKTYTKNMDTTKTTYYRKNITNETNYGKPIQNDTPEKVLDAKIQKKVLKKLIKTTHVMSFLNGLCDLAYPRFHTN